MTAARRRRRGKFGRFSAVFALLVVAAAIGGYAAASWRGFLPSYVGVRGNRTVSTRTILAHAAISPTRNIWLQDLGAAAGRVRAIPYISDVRISRIPPSGVMIHVRERTPFAIVQSGSSRFIVDRDLRVLPRSSWARPLPLFAAAALPDPDGFLRNSKVSRMRNDYLELTGAHFAIAVLRFDRFGDLEATTRSGVRFLLGDDAALPKKIAMLDPILAQVAQGRRSIATVDLRAPAAPVVVYR